MVGIRLVLLSIALFVCAGCSSVKQIMYKKVRITFTNETGCNEDRGCLIYYHVLGPVSDMEIVPPIENYFKNPTTILGPPNGPQISVARQHVNSDTSWTSGEIVLTDEARFLLIAASLANPEGDNWYILADVTTIDKELMIRCTPSGIVRSGN